MINSQRVVVVDDVPDTGEVLKAVLEPRGWHVDRVRRLEQVWRCNGGDRPSLVIVDEESVPGSTNVDHDLSGVPRVIIGSLAAPSIPEAPNAALRSYLSKPFQYAELLRAIDDLLARTPAS